MLLWLVFSTWLGLYVILTIFYNIHVLQKIILFLDANLTEKDVEAMDLFAILAYMVQYFFSFCYYRLGGLVLNMIRGLIELVFDSNGKEERVDKYGQNSHSTTGEEMVDVNPNPRYNTPNKEPQQERSSDTRVPFSHGSHDSEFGKDLGGDKKEVGDDEIVGSSCRYGGVDLDSFDFETVEDAGTMNTSRYGGFDDDELGSVFESKGEDNFLSTYSSHNDDFSADPIGMLESTWREEKTHEESQGTVDPLQELKDLCEKANHQHRKNFEKLKTREEEDETRHRKTLHIIKAEGSEKNALIKQYEEQERLAKLRREEKIREIKELVHENTAKNPRQYPLDMDLIEDLLRSVNGKLLRVDESIAKRLSELRDQCMYIIEKLNEMDVMKVDILHPDTIHISEYEEEAMLLNQILEDSTAIRLRVGKHPILRHALRVQSTLKDLSSQEEEHKKASQSILADVSLPEASIPWLGKLDKDLGAYLAESNDANIRQLLAYSIDLFDQFASVDNLNLDKNQFFLLWSRIFDAFVNAVSKLRSEKPIYSAAYLLYGVFQRIGTSAKKNKSYTVLRKLLIESMVKVSPICLPLLSHEDDSNEECSKSIESRINIVRLYGAMLSIFSQDRRSSNGVVLKEAWTWLIRTSKILIRASLMLGQKNSGAENHSEEVLHGRILETCRALRSFLRVCGNTLLEKYRHHMLGDSGLLKPILTSLDTLAGKAYAGANSEKFKSHVKEVSNLKKLVEPCLQIHIFAGASSFASQRSLYGNLLVVVNKRIKKERSDLESSEQYKLEERERDSIPWRLKRIKGTLSKERNVELLQKLIVDVAKTRKELLKLSLLKIAEEVVAKCGDESFERKNKVNPLGISEKFNKLCDSLKSFTGFRDYFKGEFHRLTTLTIPAPLSVEEISAAGGEDKWTKRTLNALCTYALCCVTEGSALTPVDAWVWIGSIMNLVNSDKNEKIPKCYAYFIDTFLRIVAQTLLQEFGNKFMRLVQALEATLMPRLEEDPGKRLLRAFLTEFKQGGFPSAFSDS